MKRALIAFPILIGLLVAVGIILLVSSAYVVDETKQVVITQFGDPIGAPVTQAGLYFRIPFIQKVTLFEKRILEWDGSPSEVPTRDKKFIFVDPTARWRIADPLKFFQSVGNETGAQSRLDDIIDNATRDFITRYNLIEVVRDTNRILTVEAGEGDIESGEQLEKISIGREEIAKKIHEQASAALANLGIELIDVRVKRINYIPQVQQKVFERMISERKRAAQKLRSEGEGVRQDVMGKTEKELQKIRSEAQREAQLIRGKADAEATKISAEAYNKDPEFFAFLATLDSYRDTLKQGSSILLTTDNEYLRYLVASEEGTK